MKVSTPSLLDDEDDDKNPVEHVSKSTKLGLEGKTLPQRSQKRIDLGAKNPEDPLVRHGSSSPRRETPEGSSAEIMTMLAFPSQNKK